MSSELCLGFYNINIRSDVGIGRKLNFKETGISIRFINRQRALAGENTKTM